MSIVTSAANKYECENYSMTLSITNAVIDNWQHFKQNKEEKSEAFGVLIGGRNHDSSKLWIEACSTPLAKDKSTRSSFVLKDTGHQKLVNEYFKASNGTLGYLGTWHTHPEPTPTPSIIDLKDWHSCCERNPDRKLIFIIVGMSHFCAYHRLEKKFMRIYKGPL